MKVFRGHIRSSRHPLGALWGWDCQLGLLVCAPADLQMLPGSITTPHQSTITAVGALSVDALGHFTPFAPAWPITSLLMLQG